MLIFSSFILGFSGFVNKKVIGFLSLEAKGGSFMESFGFFLLCFRDLLGYWGVDERN